MVLSLFPSLLSYEPLAPFLLRVTLGAIFIFWSYRTCKQTTNTKGKILSVVDFVVGGLLVIGLWMQAAALIAAIMLAVGLVKKIQKKTFFSDGVNYYFILLVMAVSLLFLGAGAFAIDLPL